MRPTSLGHAYFLIKSKYRYEYLKHYRLCCRYSWLDLLNLDVNKIMIWSVLGLYLELSRATRVYLIYTSEQLRASRFLLIRDSHFCSEYSVMGGVNLFMKRLILVRVPRSLPSILGRLLWSTPNIFTCSLTSWGNLSSPVHLLGYGVKNWEPGVNSDTGCWCKTQTVILV